MIAIISDIHANIEALTRVCDDIRELGIREILCLGDIVGYGADPEACTDIVMSSSRLALMGNHDFALLHGPVGFNPIAADVIRITRGIMDPSARSEEGRKFLSCAEPGNQVSCLTKPHSKSDRWKYIEGLPQRYTEKRVLCVHASPLEPVFEYVFPDRFPSGWNPTRLSAQFELIDEVAFCGHTHMPCAITAQLRCIYPEQVGYRFQLDPREKYILNVGSVGQPRDGDSRCCYAVYDEDAATIEWRRLTYDIDTAGKKIEAMCGKGSWCATRLHKGR